MMPSWCIQKRKASVCLGSAPDYRRFSQHGNEMGLPVAKHMFLFMFIFLSYNVACCILLNIVKVSVSGSLYHLEPSINSNSASKMYYLRTVTFVKSGAVVKRQQGFIF